ncbi:unnamed protein product [Scytosiphon promiscuus]
MQRNGGAGLRHTATHGLGDRSSNGNSSSNGNGHTNGEGRSLSPARPRNKSQNGSRPTRTVSGSSPGSPSSAARHRRISFGEGVELTREPWNQRGERVERGWESTETEVGVFMGGATSRNAREGGGGGSTGYEVVEREEPLLGDEVLGGEAKRDSNDDSVAAGVLWSAGDNPSLSSGGDASLGPAFGRHGRSGGAGEGGDNRRYSINDDVSTGVGGGRGSGGCTISGRALVYLCAMCSSLCSILLGYDVGVMSGAKEFIKPDLGLTTVQNEVMVGSLNIVAAFGGLLAGKTADRLGRKPTTALACIVFIVGATMMTMSHSFAFLLMGRVVTGVGVGCAMVIAPVYITELAPPDVRGMLVSLTDICINVGIVFGYGASLLCSDVFESDSGKWRSMIGIGMLPPLLILACLSLMPESPRWLIATGNHVEALRVLKRVMDDDAEAERTLETIAQATSTREATWKDVLLPTDRTVKAAMVLGVGLGFWQQASGSEVEAAVYYTPEVLKNKGWQNRAILRGNMGVGGFKLLGEVVAFMLLDRIGRRPLFLASSTLVTFCLLMVGSAFLLNWTSMLTLFWLCMFMFTFSLGLGPVTFVVASEIFPVAVRGKAMSVVIFVNRMMSGVIALSYQSLSEAMTPAGSFYFFSALSAVSVAFYYFLVPETRGRTLEQITADLGSSSPPSLPGPRGNVSSSSGPRHVPLPASDEEVY